MQQPHQGMYGPMPGNFPLASVTTEQIQKYLDENKQLILAILDNQNLGKLAECAQYQAQLQKNLLYLAAIADAQPQVPTVRAPTFPSGGMPTYLQQHQQQQPMASFSPRPPTAAMAFNPAQPLHRPQFGAAEARLGFNNGDAAGSAADNREQLLSASSSLSPRQKV